MIARLLISPSIKKRVEEIGKILGETGLTNPHPDLLYFPAEVKLGIEQARIIKKHFSFKPYQAKGRGVVLEDASQLTIEAQNALLKILEEPPTEATLILAAPSDVKFLPTILSRCQVERVQGIGDRVQEDYSEDIEKLLDSVIAERFEYIEKLKDREEFLKFMVFYFHQKLTEPATHARPGLARLEFLKELMEAEKWAAQNVNIRAILEYLMLVMPQKL